MSKVQFFESELKLLGVDFSKAGKKIDLVKVQTITECPEPKTVKQLQQFLGMVNFVSGFIPHYATAMYPLYQLLKKSEKMFALSEEGRLAIQEIKKILIQETMIYNIDHKLPLYLSVDASQCGVGGFLYQLKIYEKTPEGEKQMFHDLGYVCT